MFVFLVSSPSQLVLAQRVRPTLPGTALPVPVFQDFNLRMGLVWPAQLALHGMVQPASKPVLLNLYGTDQPVFVRVISSSFKTLACPAMPAVSTTLSFKHAHAMPATSETTNFAQPVTPPV